MRLRGTSMMSPKPMVQNRITAAAPGTLMKYYAHFGHKDFILCLGHKAT